MEERKRGRKKNGAQTKDMRRKEKNKNRQRKGKKNVKEKEGERN